MEPSELQKFYEGLTQQLRRRGAICAITSGLACVNYGIAETTQDCDLLCQPEAFNELLLLLMNTAVEGAACRYRGNISPPLDLRWHAGGWTSHFEWPTEKSVLKLDVFGNPIRESGVWQSELAGLYAGPITVAEMKRTHRDKDWSAVTALGVRMIEAGDTRGFLQIFSAETLRELLHQSTCPSELAARRPALRLAMADDLRVGGALNAERKLWEELDRQRVQILEHALRPYVAAVRQTRAGRTLSLREDHELRLEQAEARLPQCPLRSLGIDRLIAEARERLVQSGTVPEQALGWLPDVSTYFRNFQ